MVIEIIVALLLFILFLPIKVNLLFYINLLANKGALAVKVFTQPVMQDKFKIAAIGIIVAVLNQLLIRSGREDQAMMTTLAGLIVVLTMVVGQISQLFALIKQLFQL